MQPTIVLAATSFVTTAFAAKIAFFPMVTPAPPVANQLPTLMLPILTTLYTLNVTLEPTSRKHCGGPPTGARQTA
jgi:hypothetical protein